ncbi:MAG: HAD-IB family hydrolase [Parachlamydiaceae bacterium]|nr:HAD-IB family hydrolase [Parachlamydiaceae bacterium]
MTKKTIAVFDFDKTITTRDSLVPFLVYLRGSFQAICKFTILSPYFIGFIFGIISRQRTKERVLESFCKGMSISELRDFGNVFARHELNGYVRPEAIERIKWHQNQGHQTILVSASLNFYLIPWAEMNGFNDSITSIIAIAGDGKVTGKLQGKNCWGPEKKRRLIELVGPKENYTLYVYGDSKGDADILEMADYPFYRKLS